MMKRFACSKAFAIQVFGSNFKHASERLRRELDVVRLALACNPYNILHALIVDPESLLTVLNVPELENMALWVFDFSIFPHVRRLIVDVFVLAEKRDFSMDNAEEWISFDLHALWPCGTRHFSLKSPFEGTVYLCGTRYFVLICLHKSRQPPSSGNGPIVWMLLQG